MSTVQSPFAWSLRISVVPAGPETLRITVVGDLDAFTVRQLSDQVNQTFSVNRPDRIELDLDGVEFVDSAAAIQLRRLYHQAIDAGCHLRIIAAQQYTWWVLNTLGLTAIFPGPAGRRGQSEPGS